MTSFAVGIDLGTTHTALAYRSTQAQDASECRDFAIEQLVSAGKVGAQPLLPSFLYQAPDGELVHQPGVPDKRYCVGEYARSRASETAGRVVSSAKSWLSCPGVDHQQVLLPVDAAPGVARVSAVEASLRFLEHLVQTWNAVPVHSATPLGSQEIVLTVPASFDAAARELTVDAARSAGLENLTLLEEPQAALYGLIDALGDKWRQVLKAGDVVCVVDVGGGTTDFSLIAVTEVDGALELARVAVGDHVLLGGDNMDLQLAHAARQELTAQGKTLDRAQFASLVHGCRQAKERLLSAEPPETAAVVVPSRGAKLIGGTLRVELLRTDVEHRIVDGFFPLVSVEDHPAQRARLGLTQQGLPYAAEPAVTKHLASFLSKHSSAAESVLGADSGGGSFVHPTCLLFNGGVFQSPALRARVEQNLNNWLAAEGAPPVRVLPCEQLSTAVARGASFFARARRLGGPRIRGGTARSYYVGIESPAPAVPGLAPPLVALCVASFGMEEGSAPVKIAQDLGVVVGEPVDFPFFSSSTRRDDVVGVTLDEWTTESLERLAPVRVSLVSDSQKRGTIVPIQLRSSVTSVGTLLLEAVPQSAGHSDEVWTLELSVRGDVHGEVES